MNLANKKVRKAFNKLQVGERICLPWAILEAAGQSDRPDSDAWIGFNGKVFHFNPTDAGMVIERHPDEPDEFVKAMAGM